MRMTTLNLNKWIAFMFDPKELPLLDSLQQRKQFPVLGCRKFLIGLAEFRPIRVSCSAKDTAAPTAPRKMSLPRIPSDSQLRSRFRGCLLGGAVGDALGAPVEFLDLDEIVRAYGEQGIRDYAPAYGKLGAITDDTQMTLFTAEAMLSAHLAAALQSHEPDFFRAAVRSYARWLMTQENSRLLTSTSAKPSWLLQQNKLFSRRAPGTTCISALQTSRGKVTRATNESKGCGGVMRIAPVGMYFAHSQSREHQSGRVRPDIFADRKSTRLNSSHGSIS